MVAFLFAGISFASYKQNELKCADVKIQIDESDGQYFIQPEDIRRMLNDQTKFSTETPVSNINISLLEKLIENNPFISNAEVYSTIDGNLNIYVQQRKPVIRIFNTVDESFYIDEHGVYMPLSDEYTARVVCANGYLLERYVDKSVFVTTENKTTTATNPKSTQQLYEVAMYLEENAYLKSLIEQMYYTPMGDIELIPKIADQRIIIGDSKDLPMKFEKLLMFYNRAVVQTGWEKYSVINLKFKDQVVCTKRIASDKNN